jgi:molybdopterin synthase catalytic subunit
MNPPDGDDWIALTSDPLPVDVALAWATRPDCGAVVTFSGTVRDHAEGRDEVTALDYEAYDGPVLARLALIAEETRQRWPMAGRLALMHRTGHLVVGETSVVVVASAPHRAEAFEAACFAIDTLKLTVPIWKKETWAGGSDWGSDASPVGEVRTRART